MSIILYRKINLFGYYEAICLRKRPCFGVRLLVNEEGLAFSSSESKSIKKNFESFFEILNFDSFAFLSLHSTINK